MSLGTVLASATLTTARPSSSSGQGLSATGVEVVIGVAALLLVSLAIAAWIATRDRRRRRRFRRAGPQGPAVSLAARSAFARGDYMAVIDMAKLAMPAAIKLLVAQSYARTGADGLAVNTASEAITAILTASDWSDADPMKGFSVLETQALRSWLGRLDGVDQGFDQARLKILRARALGRTRKTPEESEVAATEERPAGSDTNLRLTGADYLAALLTATPSLRAQFFGNPIRTIGKALPPSKYWDYGVGSKMSFRWRHPQQ
jgi:hypothetical protein